MWQKQHRESWTPLTEFITIKVARCVHIPKHFPLICATHAHKVQHTHMHHSHLFIMCSGQDSRNDRNDRNCCSESRMMCARSGKAAYSDTCHMLPVCRALWFSEPCRGLPAQRVRDTLYCQIFSFTHPNN